MELSNGKPTWIYIEMSPAFPKWGISKYGPFGGERYILHGQVKGIERSTQGAIFHSLMVWVPASQKGTQYQTLKDIGKASFYHELLGTNFCIF